MILLMFSGTLLAQLSSDEALQKMQHRIAQEKAAARQQAIAATQPSNLTVGQVAELNRTIAIQEIQIGKLTAEVERLKDSLAATEANLPKAQAANAVPNPNARAGPTLSGNEEAFLDAVSIGMVDDAKSAMVAPLNWQQVATPALEAIMQRGKLMNVFGQDEPDFYRQEREFWTDLANRMVQKGADVNAAIAAMPGASDVASLDFLISHGANVNAIDPSDGGTALYHLVLADPRYADRHDDEVSFLISKGAHVNVSDQEGNTPLHNAAKSNSVKEISLLIAAGANVNAKNKSGQTPLAIADLAMQKDAAELLKSRGGGE
jgi:uncharacterized small protein (DUF1192 family)